MLCASDDTDVVGRGRRRLFFFFSVLFVGWSRTGGGGIVGQGEGAEKTSEKDRRRGRRRERRGYVPFTYDEGREMVFCSVHEN